MEDEAGSARVEAEYGVLLAIDWADQKHVWVLEEVSSGKRRRGEVGARPEEIEEWVGELQSRYAGQVIAVALEQARGALLCMLSNYAGLVIYPVNPATAGRMRSALYVSGSKSDPLDAEILLDLLKHHRDHLRKLEADTVETRKLRLLVEDRRALVNERTRAVNQLRAKLKLYYPQVMDWVDDLASPLAWAFLQRWPTLGELKRARWETVQKFFSGHGSRSEQRMEQRRVEIPGAVIATADEAVVEASVRMVLVLVKLLVELDQGILGYDRAIRETAAVHEDFGIYDSLPGAGAVMVPRLIAAMGTIRERFRDAGELQSYTGIGPVMRQTGRSCQVGFRWACPKFVRQTFHEWAGHSIAASGWAKEYYEEQLRRGKRHHAAVRALAFKWQRIVFRCWKNRERYDEGRYLAALRRSGSPYGKVAA